MSREALLIFLVLFCVQMIQATAILDRKNEAESKTPGSKQNPNQHHEEFFQIENSNHGNNRNENFAKNPAAAANDENELGKDIGNISQIFNTVSEINEAPYVGSVWVKNARTGELEYACMCVLLSETAVATSAVCHEMMAQFFDSIRFWFGTSNIKNPGPNKQERLIATDGAGKYMTYVHPLWKKGNPEYNVAVNYVSVAFDITPYVQKATPCSKDYPALLLTIYSWGQTKTNEPFPERLQKRNVASVPYLECCDMWALESSRGSTIIVPRDSVCTWPGSGERKGDTGAPLIYSSLLGSCWAGMFSLGNPTIRGLGVCPDIHVLVWTVSDFLENPKGFKQETVANRQLSTHVKNHVKNSKSL